ncbi:hypothetical protein ACDF64_12975 [Agromyces sp. MMS24-JH15]|uniref:aggregation-promoting factor C-terminal-like domain-containing protein n=1 Tax=Agromyces sp. MMS24-JH15 TaxID=3243765 RepID=UPI0037494D14
MRNTSTSSSRTSTPDRTAPAETAAPEAAESGTRRANRLQALGRRRIIVAGAIAATVLVVGSGFTIQSAVQANERAAATAAVTNATGLHADQLAAYSTVAEAKAISHAEDTLGVATDTLAAASGKVDSTALAASVASLSEYRTLPTEQVIDLTKQTQAEAGTVRAAAEEYDRIQAQKAAEAAAAAAEAQARANTPDGARGTARELAAARGWGDSQFQCLDNLWQKESGWNYAAYNASSGATGIPQSLPGSKMASAGADWATNATTQISWGLDYIARAYGTPCSAWGHSQSMNWY